MNISLQEAVDLLRKWRGEKRLIQCGLFYSSDSNCAMMGRIEHVDAESLRIDARSRDIAGQRYGLALKMSDATKFSFEDWREAPEEDAAALRSAYDGVIFVEMPGGYHYEIYALKLADEVTA